LLNISLNGWFIKNSKICRSNFLYRTFGCKNVGRSVLGKILSLKKFKIFIKQFNGSFPQMYSQMSQGNSLLTPGLSLSTVVKWAKSGSAPFLPPSTRFLLQCRDPFIICPVEYKRKWVLGMLGPCHPRTQETEAEGWQVQGQPGLCSETLS
jgi:hypothetical protein